MNPGPLISDSEKDQHKSRDQLLKEISELRAQLAARTESLGGCERVVGMLDGITEPVMVLDDASQVVYANSAAVRLFATDHEAIEGRSLWDLYPKGPDTMFHRAYEKASNARSTGKFREQHRLLGKWFEIYLYPVSGGMTVLFNDITVSRQMEELPRLALMLLHNLKDNIFLMRADGRLFHVNNETQDSLGYTSDELHKMRIFDVVPSSCASEWHDILDRIRQHGSMTFESRLHAGDGHEFPVEVYANFIQIYGQAYYTVSARDITERKRAGEAQAFLASIVNSTDDAIIGKDLEGTITSWNSGAEKLYGYRPGEAVGNNISMLTYPDHPGEIPMILEKIKLGERVEHFQTVNKRNDGTPVDVSLTVSPMFDAGGHTVGSSTIARDITELKRYEEALIDAKSRAEMYVDLMGHDINNMNMVAMGSLEIALMDMEQDGKLDSSSKPLLDKSLESLNNSSELIRNVQKLQRASTEGIKLQTVDVADVLKEIIDEQRSTPGKDVTIYYKNETSHCQVTANELLRDVFVNIISNAIKHSGRDGHLTIGVTVERVVEGGRKSCRIAIEDNGSGIPDDVKDRLFRRFSRGSTKVKGSGLGLYLVKTLVEHYGGDIRVEDRVPGDYSRGAKFVITLPYGDS